MIPINYYKYKETPIWVNSTIPEILQHKHNTKAWVYAKIILISWDLEYTIFNHDESINIVKTLTPSNSWIMKPQEWHKIKPLWIVKLFVEFYKENPNNLTKKRNTI
jgi:tellurite resistance-related uncharacterized protein